MNRQVSSNRLLKLIFQIILAIFGLLLIVYLGVSYVLVWSNKGETIFVASDQFRKFPQEFTFKYSNDKKATYTIGFIIPSNPRLVASSHRDVVANSPRVRLQFYLNNVKILELNQVDAEARNWVGTNPSKIKTLFILLFCARAIAHGEGDYPKGHYLPDERRVYSDVSASSTVSRQIVKYLNCQRADLGRITTVMEGDDNNKANATVAYTSYTYDANSNRITAIVNGVTTQGFYELAERRKITGEGYKTAL